MQYFLKIYVPNHASDNGDNPYTLTREKVVSTVAILLNPSIMFYPKVEVD